MPADLGADALLAGRHVGLPPQVAGLEGAAARQVRPFQRVRRFLEAEVENAHGQGAVFQRFAPHFDRPILQHALGLLAQRVLIDLKYFVVRQQVERERVELIDRAADQERRRPEAPHADVRVLLVGRQIGRPQLAPANLAYHEHVAVVEMAGSGEGLPGGVVADDIQQPLREVLPRRVAHVPLIANVAGRAPAVGQPRVLRRMIEQRGVREAVDDVAATAAQGLGHFPHVRDIQRPPVVLQVVDAPGRPLPGVVGGKGILAEGFAPVPGPRLIVARTADVLGIAGGPRGGIDAGLQPQGVDRIAEPLDVGELLVPLDSAEGPAPLTLPGVVDVHVGPAVVLQPLGDDRRGRGQHFLLVHRGRVAVPTVPPHRRRQRDMLTDHDAQLADRFPLGVAGPELHGIVSSAPWPRSSR